MPKSALPKHLKKFNWSGTDNASFLMRTKKKVQYLLAAGPRVPSGFWKWREIPITLFATRGKGHFRLENTDGSKSHAWYRPATIIMETDGYADENPYEEYEYLSRIQPWCRWHISLQWPLFFNFHIIYCQKNVVKFPTYKSSFGITKMFTFGIGFKRDADKVYWLSANAGGNFE